MSANLVIIQLLHTKSDHIDFLRLCWENISLVQKNQIFYFLYHTKQYKTFLTILRHELSNDSPNIPWTHLLAILHKHKKLNEKILKGLVNLESGDSELGLFRIDLTQVDELYQKRKINFIENYFSKKNKLLKDLDFARNQGLKEKRTKLLDELKSLYPKDKDVLLAFQSEKEYQARQLFNRLQTKKTKKTFAIKNNLMFSEREKKSLLKSAKKNIKKNQSYVIDFAILFSQMEQYDLALKILDQCKNKNTDILWVDLTVSIDSQQFARALSTSAILKTKLATTEHSFALLYYQAQALYGLGQKLDAIQLLKQILKIRPNYKSANSLLLEWETES